MDSRGKTAHKPSVIPALRDCCINPNIQLSFNCLPVLDTGPSKYINGLRILDPGFRRGDRLFLSGNSNFATLSLSRDPGSEASLHRHWIPFKHGMTNNSKLKRAWKLTTPGSGAHTFFYYCHRWPEIRRTAHHRFFDYPDWAGRYF